MSRWHPLIDPKQKGATPDSNQDDMAAIRDLPLGPERDEIIEAMILDNVPFVMRKVDIYIALFPSVTFLTDDLINEGLFALTTAVKDLAKRNAPEDGGNCTGFIGKRIEWALGRLIENDEAETIPKGYAPPSKVKVVNPMDIIDTRDLIDAACESEEDRVIVEMREKGCTLEEIAARLSISRRAVFVMRHELQRRYNQLVEETL